MKMRQFAGRERVTFADDVKTIHRSWNKKNNLIAILNESLKIRSVERDKIKPRLSKASENSIKSDSAQAEELVSK